MLVHDRVMRCTENWCIMIHIVQFYVPIQNSKLRLDLVQNLVSHVSNKMVTKLNTIANNTGQISIPLKLVTKYNTIYITCSLW